MISEIWLRDFRNHGEIRIELKDGINLLFGDNGAGKTSILEAVHVALKGKSFRQGDVSDIIREGADKAVVIVKIEEDGKAHTLARQLEREGENRIKLDGREKVDEKKEIPSEVEVFTQSALEVIKGDPSRRREWIDEIVTSSVSGGRETMIQYKRALFQRNEVLKSIRKGEASKRETIPWEEMLIEKGAIIKKWRKTMADDVERRVNLWLEKRREILKIKYYGSFEDEEDYREKMDRFRERDIMRGSTMIGTHRDEMSFFLNGRNMKRRSSQGQQRMAAILMSMASSEIKKERTGKACVLMLDDLPSELDGGVTEWIMGELIGMGQVLITANTNRLDAFDSGRVNMHPLSYG